MLKRLPKAKTVHVRTGRWFGTIHPPDAGQDVGYCILWSDGVYELCLDEGTPVKKVAAFVISPRSCDGMTHFLGGQDVSRARASKSFLPVTVLRDHRVMVSALDKNGRPKELKL